jgi:Ni/Fe-hydrogenase subunit HybB-like protein
MTTLAETPPLALPRPRLLTRPFTVLLFFAATGIALIAWRFFVGLGVSTAMNDGYPWGLWIAFDVVTGTALACGGYALAIVVYVFNKGKYHPLVRPAVLTSALGYSIAGLSVMIDVGRPWLAWKLPIKIWTWNLNSVLLEVAMCIMAYTVVLWIELLPAFLEKFQSSGPQWLQSISRRLLPVLNKALIFILALGMLLPTMHQSSLGSLMMLAGPRLHALWFTPFLPLFYLITCLAMGYAIVNCEAAFSSVAFKRPVELTLLRNIGKFAAALVLVFAVLRLVDVAYRGNFGLVGKLDLYGSMFWLEMLLFIAPAVYLVTAKSASLGGLLRGSMLLALAGGLYRFNTFLTAFNPGPNWHYFPNVTEQLITLGLVAGEIALYVAIVKNFPILGGTQEQAKG